LEAPGAIPRQKVQTERGLQSVFPKTRFPEKRFLDFLREAQTLPRAAAPQRRSVKKCAGGTFSA
jgi:hypothetical protein